MSEELCGYTCYCQYCESIPVPKFTGVCVSCHGFMEICEECGRCDYCIWRKEKS